MTSIMDCLILSEEELNQIRRTNTLVLKVTSGSAILSLKKSGIDCPYVFINFNVNCSLPCTVRVTYNFPRLAALNILNECLLSCYKLGYVVENQCVE